MTDNDILLLYNVFISNVNDIVSRGKYMYIQRRSNSLFSNDDTDNLSPWYINYFNTSYEKSNGFLFPILVRSYKDKHSCRIIDGNHRYAYIKMVNKIILAIDLYDDVMEITVPRDIVQNSDKYEVMNIFYINDTVFVRLQTTDLNTCTELYLRFMDLLKKEIDLSKIIIPANKIVNLNINGFRNMSETNEYSIRNKDIRDSIIKRNHALELVDYDLAKLLYTSYIHNLRNNITPRYEKLSNISNNIVTKEVWDDVEFSKDSLINDIRTYGLYMPISYNELSTGNTICDGVHRWHAIRHMASTGGFDDFYFLTMSSDIPEKYHMSLSDIQEDYHLMVPDVIFNEYIYLCKNYSYIKYDGFYHIETSNKQNYNLLQAALDLEIGNLINTGVFYKYGIKPDSYVYGRISE